MSFPAKRSIAVLIKSGDRILSVRRPYDDDELPGVWGLPAGSYRGSETLEDLVSRIGVDKLGVRLIPVRKLADGVQSRARPPSRWNSGRWRCSCRVIRHGSGRERDSGEFSQALCCHRIEAINSEHTLCGIRLRNCAHSSLRMLRAV
jgi:ADP-ribose pyrophosphatase YjhB (NUDIX family)